MAILSAQTIRERCALKPKGWGGDWPAPLVEPFYERTAYNGRTFGLSGCGYDIRLDKDVWLWPFWGRLAASIEHFNMPNDLCAEVKDKSTNARMFVLVQNTIIEPGWRGYLTLELTRFLPWPIYLRKGTPIAQVVFKPLDKPTEQPYEGKYQDQEQGAQAARLVNRV